MLKGYFEDDNLGFPELVEKRKRILAVEAALEIAKASVGSDLAAEYSRVEDDLKAVSNEVSNLADAIQAALNK